MELKKKKILKLKKMNNPTAIFLREDVDWNIEPEIITEENTKTKTFFIKSPTAIQVDKKNKNGRVYKRYIVENELNKRYIPIYVRQGRAWGELGHPDSHRIIEQNISHRFTDIFSTDSNYYGIKAKIHNTPNGNIVKALLEDKEGRLGISTRAIGSVQNEGGINYVQEDFHLITAGDIVVDPSAQEAFITGLLENHQKYYSLIEGEIVEYIVNEVKNNYKSNYSIEQKRRILVNGFKNLFMVK